METIQITVPVALSDKIQRMLLDEKSALAKQMEDLDNQIALLRGDESIPPVRKRRKRLLILGSAKRRERGQSKAIVFNYLLTSVEPRSIKMIVEATGVKTTTVHYVLKGLEKEGVASVDKDFRWSTVSRKRSES